MRTIEVGDTVLIRWLGGESLSYDYPHPAVVLHVPQDTGDHWHLTTGDRTYTVNPNCSALAVIELLTKEE